MANSPTLCQEFVARAIAPFRQSFPRVYCIHYTGDLLLAAETEELLQEAFISLQRCLKACNLIVAPEKVQREAPFEYLGYLVSKSTIRPQEVSVRTGHLTTLNDFQKLLGDINWIRNTPGVTTEQSLPSFNILKGDSSPASPQSLTQEAKEAIRHIEQAIQQAQVTRVDPSQPLYLIMLKPQVIPFAILWQSHGPLEWLHLALHSRHAINPLLSMVCLLIIRGRSRAVQLFGHDPEFIACAFLTQKLVDAAFAQSVEWQLALANFTGQIKFHLPSDSLKRGFSLIDILPYNPVVCQQIEDAASIFVDASKEGEIAVYYVTSRHKNLITLNDTTKSVQKAELYAVQVALRTYPESINVYSDSQYLVKAVLQLPTAFILTADEELYHLFHAIQKLLNSRHSPIYISHIRAHTDLPGPLVAGNRIADAATHLLQVLPITTPLETAKRSRDNFHQNAAALRREFKISREAAKLLDSVATVHNSSHSRSMPLIPEVFGPMTCGKWTSPNIYLLGNCNVYMCL
uniref:RNase H type-1 domain-containing protein n=1 Tax=Lynx canadensis TaxID=61383 RepID=A0A667I7A2_LYNCA